MINEYKLLLFEKFSFLLFECEPYIADIAVHVSIKRCQNKETRKEGKDRPNIYIKKIRNNQNKEAKNKGRKNANKTQKIKRKKQTKKKRNNPNQKPKKKK